MDLEFKQQTVAQHTANYLQLNDFDESKPSAHFAPGNGFPIKTYRRLFAALSPELNLSCLPLRAEWPNSIAPQQIPFHDYAEHLIQFIEANYTQPIIGMGHSLGAASTVIAASKRPDLFRAVVIVEPVSLSVKLAWLVKWAPFWYKKTREPLKSTLKKQYRWRSRADYFDYCRGFKPYRRISDTVLNDFAEYSLIETPKGDFQLAFSPQWELAHYATGGNINAEIQQLQIPLRVLLGKPSYFLSQALRDFWQTNAIDYEFIVNNQYGHLYPFEAPEECTEQLLAFISPMTG